MGGFYFPPLIAMPMLRYPHGPGLTISASATSSSTAFSCMFRRSELAVNSCYGAGQRLSAHLGHVHEHDFYEHVDEFDRECARMLLLNSPLLQVQTRAVLETFTWAMEENGIFKGSSPNKHHAERYLPRNIVLLSRVSCS